MARMTEEDKRNVPASERGVPGKSGTGSYPMPDAQHARAAIGFAAMHHGSAFASKIRAKAKKLGFGDGKPKANKSQHGGKVFQE
jgi:hypothetical protein